MHWATSLQQAVSRDADGWQMWTAVASAVIAAFALLVSFSNRGTAKKALELAERQEERRIARLDLSLIDEISWRPVEGKCRWIGVRVLAVNPTDRDGSLVAADLHVTYTLASGDGVVVKVPHGAAGVKPPEGITALEIPTRLQANGAVTGWLMFKLDDALLADRAIERYDVVIHDSRGPVATAQAWALREIVDGKAP
jgi:hypothetical protein